jgi:hypothetical protein
MIHNTSASPPSFFCTPFRAETGPGQGPSCRRRSSPLIQFDEAVKGRLELARILFWRGRCVLKPSQPNQFSPMAPRYEGIWNTPLDRGFAKSVSGLLQTQLQIFSNVWHRIQNAVQARSIHTLPRICTRISEYLFQVQKYLELGALFQGLPSPQPISAQSQSWGLT